MTRYNPADNSQKCYELAIRELRLACIRAGSVLPRRGHPDEVKAWEDGERERSRKAS